MFLIYLFLLYFQCLSRTSLFGFPQPFTPNPQERDITQQVPTCETYTTIPETNSGVTKKNRKPNNHRNNQSNPRAKLAILIFTKCRHCELLWPLVFKTERPNVPVLCESL